MKKIAIMQPYFLPYIGYFQLLNAVDEFVIYDNIQFTKKGWIHRNRILENGKDVYISLPIKKDSDYLNVDQRFISDAFKEQRQKMLNKIKNNYQKAPYYNKVYPLIEEIINYEESNLFNFLLYSIKQLSTYLNINTPIIASSSVAIDHGLKSTEKVKAIIKAQNAGGYINAVGGKALYDKDNFKHDGIDLDFLQTNDINYAQFKNEFVPFLSILDVMMFNSKDEVGAMLNKYTLE